MICSFNIDYKIIITYLKCVMILSWETLCEMLRSEIISLTCLLRDLSQSGVLVSLLWSEFWQIYLVFNSV